MAGFSFTQKKQALVEEAVHEAVYDAVLQVLNEQGLEKLTVGRVAKAAGISTGTVYNYFKDKDALLVYVLERLLDQVLTNNIAIAGRDIAAIEKLHEIAKDVFVYFEKKIELFRFFDQAQTFIKVDMGKKQEHVRTEIELISEVIRQGISEGLFRQVDANSTASLFHSAMIGIMRVRPVLGTFRATEDAEELVNVFKAFLVKEVG